MTRRVHNEYLSYGYIGGLPTYQLNSGKIDSLILTGLETECQLSESCQLKESPSIWQNNNPSSRVASPNQHARTTHQEKHRVSLDVAPVGLHT